MHCIIVDEPQAHSGEAMPKEVTPRPWLAAHRRNINLLVPSPSGYPNQSSRLLF